MKIMFAMYHPFTVYLDFERYAKHASIMLADVLLLCFE